MKFFFCFFIDNFSSLIEKIKKRATNEISLFIFETIIIKKCDKKKIWSESFCHFPFCFLLEIPNYFFYNKNLGHHQQQQKKLFFIAAVRLSWTVNRRRIHTHIVIIDLSRKFYCSPNKIRRREKKLLTLYKKDFFFCWRSF